MGTIDDRLLARYAIHLTGQRGYAASTVDTCLSDANAFRELTGGSVPIPRGWSGPRSRAKCRHSVPSIYKFLVQEGSFKATPVPSGRTTSIKVPDALPSFLTSAEIERFLKACTPQSLLEIRDRASLELIYAFGIRLSELHELNLDDMDLLRCTLTIVGKESRERVLPFGDHAWEWLMKYLEEVRPSLAKDDDQALWLNVLGTRLSRKTLGGIPKRYGAVAGLMRTVTPRVLRHSCAAQMLDGGAEPIVVAHILGLADVASAEAYERIAIEERRRDYLKHPSAGQRR